MLIMVLTTFNHSGSQGDDFTKVSIWTPQVFFQGFTPDDEIACLLAPKRIAIKDITKCNGLTKTGNGIGRLWISIPPSRSASRIIVERTKTEGFKDGKQHGLVIIPQSEVEVKGDTGSSRRDVKTSFSIGKTCKPITEIIRQGWGFCLCPPRVMGTELGTVCSTSGSSKFGRGSTYFSTATITESSFHSPTAFIGKKATAFFGATTYLPTRQWRLTDLTFGQSWQRSSLFDLGRNTKVTTMPRTIEGGSSLWADLKVFTTDNAGSGDEVHRMSPSVYSFYV